MNFSLPSPGVLYTMTLTVAPHTVRLAVAQHLARKKRNREYMRQYRKESGK